MDMKHVSIAATWTGIWPWTDLEVL